MDGNGRWAQQHKLKVALGHRAGTEALREIIRNSSDLGIGALTLYAFSTENWTRSKTEVEALMQLILDFFNAEIDELHAKNVRVTILGDKDGLPQKQCEVLKEAEKRTEGNTGLRLNIALNYGGRAEIVQAVNRLMQDKLLRGDKTPVTEDDISAYLYTAGCPEPDLIVRTGGELRLSNFLMWQSAYAELYFTDVLWPDFAEADVDAAIAAFYTRGRRFGNVVSST